VCSVACPGDVFGNYITIASCICVLATPAETVCGQINIHGALIVCQISAIYLTKLLKAWTLAGFAAMSNRCWHLANEFTNLTAQTTADAIADSILPLFKDFTCKFHTNILRNCTAVFLSQFRLLYNIFQQPTQTPSCIRSFVHCACLPVWKTFTTDVGQMQQRRHHMTARSSAVLTSQPSRELINFVKCPSN